MVLAAVEQDGRALQFASDEVRGDFEVVLTAVEQCGRALKFAAEELRRNKVIALAAVQQDAGAISLLPPQLRQDWQILRVATHGADDEPLRPKTLAESPGRIPGRHLEAFCRFFNCLANKLCVVLHSTCVFVALLLKCFVQK